MQETTNTNLARPGCTEVSWSLFAGGLESIQGVRTNALFKSSVGEFYVSLFFSCQRGHSAYWRQFDAIYMIPLANLMYMCCFCLCGINRSKASLRRLLLLRHSIRWLSERLRSPLENFLQRHLIDDGYDGITVTGGNSSK